MISFIGGKLISIFVECFSLSLDQGKHKQRKCERPLSLLSAKLETGLEAPKRYTLHDNHPPLLLPVACIPPSIPP